LCPRLDAGVQQTQPPHQQFNMLLTSLHALERVGYMCNTGLTNTCSHITQHLQQICLVLRFLADHIAGHCCSLHDTMSGH
jgi:hypothetical protein